MVTITFRDDSFEEDTRPQKRARVMTGFEYHPRFEDAGSPSAQAPACKRSRHVEAESPVWASRKRRAPTPASHAEREAEAEAEMASRCKRMRMGELADVEMEDVLYASATSKCSSKRKKRTLLKEILRQRRANASVNPNGFAADFASAAHFTQAHARPAQAAQPTEHVPAAKPAQPTQHVPPAQPASHMPQAPQYGQHSHRYQYAPQPAHDAYHAHHSHHSHHSHDAHHAHHSHDAHHVHHARSAQQAQDAWGAPAQSAHSAHSAQNSDATSAYTNLSDMRPSTDVYDESDAQDESACRFDQRTDELAHLKEEHARMFGAMQASAEEEEVCEVVDFSEGQCEHAGPEQEQPQGEAEGEAVGSDTPSLSHWFLSDNRLLLNITYSEANKIAVVVDLPLRQS